LFVLNYEPIKQFLFLAFMGFDSSMHCRKKLESFKMCQMGLIALCWAAALESTARLVWHNSKSGSNFDIRAAGAAPNTVNGGAVFCYMEEQSKPFLRRRSCNLWLLSPSSALPEKHLPGEPCQIGTKQN
jgi:hypothetical protein